MFMASQSQKQFQQSVELRPFSLPSLFEVLLPSGLQQTSITCISQRAYVSNSALRLIPSQNCV